MVPSGLILSWTFTNNQIFANDGIIRQLYVGYGINQMRDDDDFVENRDKFELEVFYFCKNACFLALSTEKD